MNYTMKGSLRGVILTGMAVVAGILPVAARAETSVWIDSVVGELPCMETMVKPELMNPCVAPNAVESRIRDAWMTAAIIGYTRQPTVASVPQTDSALQARVTALEAQNASLEQQIGQLNQRMNQIASAPIPQPTQVTTYVQAPAGNMDARLSALEKQQSITSGYMLMLEQRIGELYAKVDPFIAAVKKILKMK